MTEGAVPLPAWGAGFSDQETVRGEVVAIAESFITALLEYMPAETVTGVFAKGSAYKAWDSPIDYVPELNDVDLHVQFAAGRPENDKGFEIEAALAIAAATDEKYFARTSAPVHLPRLQFIPLEFMRKQPRYIPSPSGTKHLLVGSMPHESPVSLELSRESARLNLLEQASYLEMLGSQVIDKPGFYAREVLRRMVWRVSPSVPRLLEVLGLRIEDVWSANRTQLVRLLESIGECELGADYAEFYLQGWKYFLSAYGDSAAGRQAIHHGARVLKRVMAIVKTDAH